MTARKSATASTEASGSFATMLEFVWPITALMLFIALFVPWYLQILDVPLRSIACVMAAVAALHALLPPLLPRAERVRDAALLIAHFIAIAALGYVWWRLGGLAAPLFLLFFAAPVVAASTLFGVWSRQVAFVLTLGVVTLVSAIASPALRWYAGRHGVDVSWLDDLDRFGASSDPFAHSRPEPPLEFASLVFALLALTALHASANVVADVGRRLRAQLRRVVTSLDQDEGLLGDLVRLSPVPEALVLTDSRRIVMASDRFREVFGRDAAPLAGAELLEVVELQFPESLEPLLGGRDGEIDCQFRGDDGRLHPARAHVTHLAREGTRMVRFMLEPCEESRHADLAFASLGSAVIVVADGAVISRANDAARKLFPEAIAGAPAGRALGVVGLPQSWWQAQPGTTVPRDFSVRGRRVTGRVVCRGADVRSGELVIIELDAVETP